MNFDDVNIGGQLKIGTGVVLQLKRVMKESMGLCMQRDL